MFVMNTWQIIDVYMIESKRPSESAASTKPKPIFASFTGGCRQDYIRWTIVVLIIRSRNPATA